MNHVSAKNNRRRWWPALALLLTLMMLAVGCAPAQNPYEGYERHTDSFFDTFDTLIQVIAYTTSEEEFQQAFEQIHQRFRELHQLYDIYNTYSGMNNVKTVNDQAGIAPVAVDEDLINLILFAREWHDRTAGRTNVAMGPVLKIWHDYRADGLFDPSLAELPPLEDLQRATAYTDIHLIEVDEAAGTVYLPDSRMRLDIGAVAKGYATELVAKELEAAGLESFIISAGGNVRAVNRPFDNERETWTVGLHNPDASLFAEGNSLLGSVSITNASVVTSGDYQRFYIVDGQPVHHLIDPVTLMPAAHYRALTVVMEDSGQADFFSTELFLLPFEESLPMAESIEGLEVIWVMPDGSIEMTGGLEVMLTLY
ncbi:FAD:protein FMN transferase [Anoxynatronum buryatiense]|uniref:FAD:protein FMN transferase n=1 Tax=Anoxynatronum buryatiense TaxID=489973 RepID=A0AA46AJV9_9CLOT|nr:FAD:protein FMN transferase [Anoxynatronum buryatiense]SMP64995.1 thiamine biosynthesis lipoprotein [Anoxynatronum buryatiense]